jgi:hypothetical protein
MPDPTPTVRLRGAIRGTPFHYLHEPAECVASCATCREENDLCKCLHYGRGLNATRVPVAECEIHA